MRTTLELPDPLFHRAKMIAQQRRITLKRLITAALERELEIGHPMLRRMTVPPIGLNVAPSSAALTNAEIGSLQDADELLKAGR